MQVLASAALASEEAGSEALPYLLGVGAFVALVALLLIAMQFNRHR